MNSTIRAREFTRLAVFLAGLLSFHFSFAQSDACGTPTAIAALASCVNGTSQLTGQTLSGKTQSAPNVASSCTGTPGADVWYSFTPQTANPTITLTALGTGFQATATRVAIQVMSGACGSLTDMGCSRSAGSVGVTTFAYTASGLTPNTPYLIRVYTLSTAPSGATWTYNICVTETPPANDDCAGAITLANNGNTCTAIVGNVVYSTLSAGIPAPTCGAPVYDVWYSFTAQSATPTISITSNTNFANPHIQLLSGACGGLANVSCSATGTLNATGLVVGNTYFVRVYSTSALPTTAGTFNICVTDPVPSNDDCSNAATLVSGTSCSNTGGTLYGATATSGISAFCINATSSDVWYTFVAQSTLPTIRLSSMTSGMSVTPGIQLFNTNSCAIATINANSNKCQTGSNVATLNMTPASALTIGSTYLVRIASNSTMTGAASTWTYNICITDPLPSNDDCAAAITLTSSTSCVNTTASMYGATLSAVTVNTPNCAGTVTYDEWYKFVAQTTNPTITLSSIGGGFANASLQLLSNNCGGTFNPLFCGTTSIAADYLVPGTTYFIRVYSTTGSAPLSYASGAYSICVVDPVTPPVYNDECTTAITLPVGVNTCSTLPTTTAGATASANAIAPCTGPVAYDVWYKFVATSTSSTITLGGAANNFTGRNIQILSGTCGSLTSVACGTSPLAFASVANTTYYVRVYSTIGPAPNGNADFTICVNGGINAPIRFGNSYVNLTKQTNGGVVEPGDILEIRMTINHTSGTMTNLRFVDNVPSKTSMLATSADSIRIITNEGLTYKKYTPAADADAATYKASPGVGEYNIRLNLGFASGAAPNAPANNTNSSTSANGQMNAATDRPRGGGGMLFAISYRVQVTGVVGDTIQTFPGQFIYNNGAGDITLTATPFNILISSPLNLCSNSIGLNNAVENGGTFGSGTALNRGTDLTTPIAGYTYVPNVSANVSVNDGRYAIVKNMSPRSSTQQNARRQPNCAVAPTLAVNDPLACVNRMFGGFWYIDGDHTGTNNATGNAPPSSNATGGYMLEVNADYVASEVYRQTVNNLCPNTYYEFSAWVRNICPTCGIDSTGTSTYRPGVLPNLTFTLDNLDYYNTGEVDTFGWLKKGFVFKTTSAQTTASFSIRNNSQGGGGNDWTLDDIAIATCLPSMQYSPSIFPMICNGNTLVINDTVRSYFDNYTYYRWQRSVDAGSSWTDITSTTNASQSYNGSIYQFITSDTLKPSQTTLADSGDLYRVIVATSNPNLSNTSCLFTDVSTIITLNVLNCGPVLNIDLLSFSGKLNNSHADLLWVTTKETEPVSFILERSTDGTNFSPVASIAGHGNSSETNNYVYTDPQAFAGKTWYRLALYTGTQLRKYSRVIMLTDKTADFMLESVVNPFSHELDFGVTIPENSRIDAIICDLSGRPVKRESFNAYQGANSMVIPNTDVLPPGVYILQIRNRDKVINKKVLKK
ncbi:MAG TPA: T9SS type A sorting domain-containing protein [Chitinophagaceae bacterium]